MEILSFLVPIAGVWGSTKCPRYTLLNPIGWMTWQTPVESKFTHCHSCFAFTQEQTFVPNEAPRLENRALSYTKLEVQGSVRLIKLNSSYWTLHDANTTPGCSLLGVFLLLLLIAAYAGLTSIQLGQYVNDKVLHFTTFFALTVAFYWVVDTNRRRVMNMALVVCTIVLGVGSEFVQSFLDNGREFDLYDIIANVIGSLLGVGLCSWYHKRMLERKRRRRYSAVPGEEQGDVELGEGHESGVVEGNSRSQTLEEEVDNWDENENDDDWDEDETHQTSTNTKVLESNADNGDLGDTKKRMD
ncbi:hypothetical protein FAGAP_10346 [Fusarium agapanthi]|uniref:VanZ-like domain-containing protein n=1 Tax=Fusarium agapanthi TaxID=1803897 RepID=A0A9P5B0Z6_9HYPO|nr:hypothetical protein FAGAP_10346 [Fusarium agapanthi]